MRRDSTFEPMNESTEPPEPPVDDAASRDPYEELENVFDEPILLEDADLPEPPQRPAGESTEADASPGQLQGAPEGIDDITRRLWARLGALEGEIRRGSERTLEALRRLGERMGAELAMLDKRAINLELTVARLRAVTEAVESATRRGPDARATPEPSQPAAPASPPAPDPKPAAPMWEPPRDQPDASPQEALPGTQPEPPDWRHPSFGPPLDDEPPDDG
jgi:hypothetical protein